MTTSQNNTPITQRAHELIQQVLGDGDIAVDATVGNGHDTLFLSQSVGNSGKVYGFDVQQEALDKTYHKLKTNHAEKQVALFHAGHETMPILLPENSNEKINAIMFNLGYLPGGDKNRTTGISTTLAALEASLMLLATGGRITILAYTGHPGGREETEAVKNWAKLLPTDLYSTSIQTTAVKNDGNNTLQTDTENSSSGEPSYSRDQKCSPELIMIHKRFSTAE